MGYNESDERTSRGEAGLLIARSTRRSPKKQGSKKLEGEINALSDSRRISFIYLDLLFFVRILSKKYFEKRRKKTKKGARVPRILTGGGASFL